MSPRPRQVDPLKVSELSVAHLIATGGDATVADLAAVAGISERTFHRLFETKGDVIRPMFRAGSTTMARVLAERPDDEDLPGAFLATWQAVAAGVHADRTRLLMPIILASPTYSSVWEQSLREGDRQVADAITARLDVPTSAAMTLAVTLLAQVRLAITRSVAGEGESSDLLREQLDTLVDSLGGSPPRR